MNWYVIDTRTGLWIEQSLTEPQTAVAGPYETHCDALDKLRRLERIDGRNGRVAGLIGLAWLGLMLAGFVVWAIGRVG